MTEADGDGACSLGRFQGSISLRQKSSGGSPREPSRGAQRAVAACRGKCTSDDQGVADETLKEASEGRLLGLFIAADLTRELGPNWVPSRRFPIRQGLKLWPIDDFSEYGVNQAFGSRRKAAMKGLDYVIALARGWVKEDELVRQL